MPHQLRLEYPGAIYHAMVRGGQSDDSRLDNVDRRDFIETFAGTQWCQAQSAPVCD